jgi:multiple sugar transport system permease protein
MSIAARKSRTWTPTYIVTVFIPAIFFLVFMLFPFYWMLVTSLKPDQELYNLANSPFYVKAPSLVHYVNLFTQTLFLTWSWNSVLIAVVATAISVFCSVIAGYALARLRFRGATTMGWVIFITYLVPPTLLFLPLTQVIGQLHLLNSLWAAILTYPTFMIPFATWLLMGYFRGIPSELEEAALIDGASRIRAMVSIIIPLALPGILSAGMFAFTLSWNEYIYALVFLQNSGIKTIPIGVSSDLIRGDVFFWGELMAGALLGSVPVALLYSFFAQYFVAGMTAGAVKG